MTDQNRKTLRSFYCRDYLWELFEQMTQDLGCSMDYLINESMRLYARSRDYAPGDEGGAPQGGAGFGGPPPQGGGGFGGPPQQGPGFGSGQSNPLGGGFGGNAMEHRTFDRIPPVGQQQPPQQPPQQQQRSSGGFGGPPQGGAPGGPPPPPPRPGGGGGFGGPPQPSGGGFGGGSNPGGNPGWNQPGGSGFGAQPQGGGFNGGQPMAGGQQPLYLLFNNNRYVVDKEKFVIGRGSQQTDLTIRDGNISRKHCAVLFRNGSYYIKDLDSTNGVEFRGNRIESKKVDEGDIFYLCDYELRFTYRP